MRSLYLSCHLHLNRSGLSSCLPAPLPSVGVCRKCAGHIPAGQRGRAVHLCPVWPEQCHSLRSSGAEGPPPGEFESAGPGGLEDPLSLSSFRYCPRACPGSVAGSLWPPRHPRGQTWSVHTGRRRVGVPDPRLLRGGQRPRRREGWPGRREVVRTPESARPAPACPLAPAAPPPAARPRPAGLLRGSDVTARWRRLL